MVPNLARKIVSSPSGATVANLNPFGPDATRNTPWVLPRSSMFLYLCVCDPVTDPAQVLASPHPLALASDPSVHLPPKQVSEPHLQPLTMIRLYRESQLLPG